MQAAERSTRSSHRFLAEQLPPAEADAPGGQSESGQYMCIECSETFDTKLDLSAHRQNHSSKKPFTCAECGTGFHHQAFLQMHERSHEDSARSTPGRALSTRSSKMAEAVHVKPAEVVQVKPVCPKPGRLLNSVVTFRTEQKPEPGFLPRECVTRRTHGSISSGSQRRESCETSRFQLRISKMADAAVHLIDPFGNSIEILTDVFDSYTLSEQDGLSARVEETEDMEETAAASAGCAAAAEPPLAPPPAASELDADLPPQPSAASRSPPEKPGPAASPPVPRTAEDAAEEPAEHQASCDAPIIPSAEAASQPPLISEDTDNDMDSSPSPAPPPIPQLPNKTADLPSVSVHSDQLASGADPAVTLLPTEPLGRGPASRSEALDGAPEVTPKPYDVIAEEMTAAAQHNPASPLAQMARTGEASSAPSSRTSTAGKPEAGEEVSPEIGSKTLTNNERNEWSDEAQSGRDVSLPGSDDHSKRSEKDLIVSQLFDLPSRSAEENVNLEPESEARASSPHRDLIQHGKEPERSEGLLAGQSLLPDDELVIGDKRASDLFERDIFQLEPPGVGVPMVCGRGAHSSTVLVHEREEEDCLDSGNMKYISESEMIRLLEQDKDDPAAMETPDAMETPAAHAGLSVVGEGRASSRTLATDLESATCPAKWAEKGSEDNFCLPLSLQTPDGPAAGSPEPSAESPAKSVTKEVLSSADLLTVASDSSISLAKLDLPPLEALDVSSTQDSSLPQTEQPDKHLPNVTPENKPRDETAGLKMSDKTQSAGDPFTTEQSKDLEAAGSRVSVACEEIGARVPLTNPTPEFQATCLMPGTTLHQETEPSSDCTEISKELVANQKEDDSIKKDPQRRVKENVLQENLYVAKTQTPSEQSSTSHDLEPSGPVSLEVAELTTVLDEEADDEVENVSDLSSSSKDWPIGQEDRQGFLDDSELMDEEPEDKPANWKTPERPTGSGAECLKCGRRIRRGRKQMVWSPVCFKCRMVAKRKERLTNPSESPEFPLEAHVCRREERSSAMFPDQPIKQETDRVLGITDLLTIPLDPATGAVAKKMYKCPKCEKAFRIPALLAGHIKCHTLPQCLTCGCQIPLKYKTKRIPRRCQKCIQQMREGKSAAKESADEQSETSDNEEIPDESAEGAVLHTGGRRLSETAIDEDESLFSKVTLGKQDEDTSDELDVPADGEKPRVCPQCGKAFKCNRSLNLHLLSHSTAQCESCGCRLQKKRRAGRWSKKCRICKLQSKEQLSRDSEDQASLSGDKGSKRLKAKQAKVSQKRKMQSIIKQKKELKWKNMLLAVKKLMNKSKKRKELAAQNADLEKRSEEGLEAEKSETSSVSDDKVSIATDHSKPDPPSAASPEAEASDIQSGPNKTPKPVRKCVYKEKNIVKVEEEDSLPCTPDPAAPFPPAFLKEEEVWPCLECSQSLENLEALLSHQQCHIEGQSFTCPQCPQVFSSEEYLNVHIPAHDEKRPFRCPECDKTFTKRNHLGVHLRVHSGVRPYACPDCPRRFRQKATLLAHRYSHRNFELLLAKPHQCSVCDKSFKQKERLVVHERLHTGECPFSCKDCDEVFPSKARLYVHRKLHKLDKDSSGGELQVSCKEEEEPFHCQDCGKICSTKASFALHRKVHKLPSEQNMEVSSFYCKECEKTFASKASLSMHLKNHSAHKADTESNPDLKQSFPCKDCDKMCPSKASLAQHRKLHQSSAGEQNLDVKVEDQTSAFVCKDCDKVCATKASLALHSKVHKSPTDKEQGSDDAEAPSFRCKKCSVTFSSKTSFVLHKKTHKPPSRILKKPKDEAEPGSFFCKLCDTVFSTKASLVLHRKAHRLSAGEDGESQSFSCKDCDKVCATKASLVLHSKVHKLTLASEENPGANTEGPFVCKDCDKVCSTKASYVLHRKVHRSSSSERNLSTKGDQEEDCFQCKECDRMFSSRGRLSFHRFKKHGMPPKSDQTPDEEAPAYQPKKVSEDKLFSCTICSQRFTKLKMLVQHKAVHGDRTATPCTHCGKSFLYKKSLFNHMKICQGKTKGKQLLLLKKAATKRKPARDGSGSSNEDEAVSKKCRTEEKKKARTHQLKAKNQLEKPKRANKEKARAKAEPKTKRPKADGDTVEDEGKKSAPEKPGDVKPEKPTEPAPKEQSVKREKNVGKVKRVKKETLKEKKVRSTKKWRVMAAAKAKKKKLQAAIIGGKKKLLVKKKRVPPKPKPGAKSGQSAKEN